MYRRLVMMVMMGDSMLCSAQNTWEMPKDVKRPQGYNPDAKYLEGAVPVVDGRVVFDTTIVAKGMTAREIYGRILTYVTEMTKEEGQFEDSRVALADTSRHVIAGVFDEWLVFVRKPLNLDRTRLYYTLVARCSEGEANISMIRIHYLYDEERVPQRYTAEEWITDENGLNKKKTKLARMSGKFRKKTIDRKNYIFDQIAGLLK